MALDIAGLRTRLEELESRLAILECASAPSEAVRPLATEMLISGNVLTSNYLAAPLLPIDEEEEPTPFDADTTSPSPGSPAATRLRGCLLCSSRAHPTLRCHLNDLKNPGPQLPGQLLKTKASPVIKSAPTAPPPAILPSAPVRLPSTPLCTEPFNLCPTILPASKQSACLFCHSQNHITRDCPKYPKISSASNSAACLPPKPVDLSPPVPLASKRSACLFCLSQDHLTQDCPAGNPLGTHCPSVAATTNAVPVVIKPYPEKNATKSEIDALAASYFPTSPKKYSIADLAFKMAAPPPGYPIIPSATPSYAGNRRSARKTRPMPRHGRQDGDPQDGSVDEQFFFDPAL